MENITDGSSNSWEGTIDCEDLTNNPIYILFIGYLLPLLSPKVRNYGRELLSHWKNAGKVASDIKMLKPIEPYKGKGIKERGQYVFRKEGKKK